MLPLLPEGSDKKCLPAATCVWEWCMNTADTISYTVHVCVAVSCGPLASPGNACVQTPSSSAVWQQRHRRHDAVKSILPWVSLKGIGYGISWFAGYFLSANAGTTTHNSARDTNTQHDAIFKDIFVIYRIYLHFLFTDFLFQNLLCTHF